jgi:hypothetical protein
MDPLITIAVAIGGYLIGSVPFARLIGRRTAPDDEFGLEHLEWREGVGFTVQNVSAASIERASGERYGCLTALLDIAKAFVPTLLLRLAYPDGGYDHRIRPGRRARSQPRRRCLRGRRATARSASGDDGRGAARRRTRPAPLRGRCPGRSGSVGDDLDH